VARSHGAFSLISRILHIDLGHVDRIPSNRGGYPAEEGDFR